MIDFGIAKAGGAPLGKQSIHTRLGVLVGTPAYVSPEQADPTTPDMAARTDIYSLGLLLYGLVTGLLPLRTDATAASAVREIRRPALPENPRRPSARATDGGAISIGAADAPRTNPSNLRRPLCGELDWIAMKALERHQARSRLLGSDHPRTLTSMANLAYVYRVQRRLDEAMPLLEHVLAAEVRALYELAGTEMRLGRREEAVALRKRLVPGTHQRWPGENWPLAR